MDTKSHVDMILKFSRQEKIGPLSPLFQSLLYDQVENGDFPKPVIVQETAQKIVEALERYRKDHERSTVLIGMSGGLDSTLCASLFKNAGYNVIGVTLPIHQDPIETERGINACEKIGVRHVNLDLTDTYTSMLKTFSDVDNDLEKEDDKKTSIRRGNIRARLRMIALYNLASKYQGFVAGTDNLSELSAGFWTLHGDVGDIAPIQSLLKSWEIPYMSHYLGLPEDIVFATPTDGLGIDNGDEAQLGCTYLEWDIVLLSLLNHYSVNLDALSDDDHALSVLGKVKDRMKLTAFKRTNPLLLEHPSHLRTLKKLEVYDKRNHYSPAIFQFKGWTG